MFFWASSVLLECLAYILYTKAVPKKNLLLQQPLGAISDANRALCLHYPVNRHAKSLWRRAQAYDIMGLAKESLLDAILFINVCSQSTDPDLSSRQNKVPDYAERLVKKQMRAAWLFREAAIKHGGIDCEAEDGNAYGQGSDDSEWETASESDGEWNNEGTAEKNTKLSARGIIFSFSYSYQITFYFLTRTQDDTHVHIFC